MEVITHGNVEVSICCLTYNHSKFIRQALDSFLMQKTNFRFEIVIHDDASTDDTASIIKEYECRYPNLIKPIYQIENQRSKHRSGMNPRFNYPRAQGKYIALCEGDDYWTHPYKLQEQYNFLETHEEFIMCGHLVTNQLDEVVGNGSVCTGDACPDVFNIPDALTGTPLHVSSILFKNLWLNEKPDKRLLLFPAGDDALFLYLLGHGKGYCIRETWGVYRINSNGVWSSKKEWERFFIMWVFLRNVHLIIGNQYRVEVQALCQRMERNYLKIITRTGEWDDLLGIAVKQRLINSFEYSKLWLKIRVYQFRNWITTPR